MDGAAKARIAQSFGAQSMMATIGARLVRVEKGLVEISAPVLPGMRQQQGYGHAALTFAIGDSAAGYAALTSLPLTQEVVTAEIKINLLAPARGDLLRAVGKVIKPGRRLIVVTSEVFAEDAQGTTPVAVLQGTIVPVPA